MTTLALDPSLGCTGWAVLEGDCQRTAALVQAGTLALSDSPLPERLLELAADAGELVREVCPDLIVVEFPESKARGGGGFGQRSILSLPNYGAAVGAVFIGVSMAKAHGALVLTPCPSEWVGRRRVPGTAGDPHKTKRVGYVEWLFPAWKGKLGCKTNAGNVADAVLIGRWGVGNRELARRGG